MKTSRQQQKRRPTAGSRILASIQEAMEWVEGNAEAAQVTTVQVPMVDVRSMRRRLGLSQTGFAAKFGFQVSTVRNWEQGRTRPDGPARVLLAVIDHCPEAVEDALRRAS